nr:kinesin-like protein KIN-14L [Tanacetum cinerariifolium]
MRRGISDGQKKILTTATKDDDIEEVAALNDEAEASEAECQTEQHAPMNPIPDPIIKEESGPFGLDALILNAPKKMKNDSASTNKLKIRTCTGENGLSIADATMLPVKSVAHDLNLMKNG